MGLDPGQRVRKEPPFPRTVEAAEAEKAQAVFP